MRKILGLFILFAASGNLAFSQVKPADSLANLLRLHSQSDTGRINLLNNLAKELRRSKPKKTDSLLQESISLSTQLNYPKGKGNALTLKGIRSYDESDFPSATRTFAEAEPLLESAGDQKGLIYLLRMEANLLMDEGKHSQSLDDFLRGLKLAHETGDIKQAVDINRTIGYLYNVLGEYDKAIPYQNEALKQADSIGYKAGVSGAYNAIGKTYKTKGDYPASLDAYTRGLRIDEQISDSAGIYVDHSNIGDVYERMGNYREAFAHLLPAWNFYKKRPSNTMVPWDEWAMGKAFTHSGKPDSGLFYARHALQLSQQMGYRLYLREITFLIAESAAKLEQWDTAYKYQVLSSNLKDTLTGKEIAQKTAMLQAGFELDKKQAEISLLTKDKQLQAAENRRERLFLYALLGGLGLVLVMAVILFRSNRHKQQVNFLLEKQKADIDNKARELSVQKDNLEQSYNNVELLGEIGRKITASLSVEKIIGTVYDNVNSLMDASVFGIGIYNETLKRIEFPATYEKGQPLPFYSNSVDDQNRFDAICFRTRQEIVMGDLGKEYRNYIQNIQAPKAGDQSESLIYLPLKVKDKVMGVITVQSFEKNAYSDYHLFMLRNIAIYTAIALENADAFDKLQQTLTSLKKAQSQLIQAEKMASLGELTAGIAHEIQNPLNFVNNFSEVSVELAHELNEELNKLNLPENDRNDIRQMINDLVQNQEKINYHGRRADAIVKGMLMHSRASSGQKELTDINMLTDEYLRLSYHGLRAKDKSFNASFKTDFDESLTKIKIVPQDIGRAILNLFTNAFYSVTEKKKQTTNGYDPVVSVTTKKVNDRVEIRVRDNGMGIPQRILEKIYQPFFTTKPGGQGTGLGLSLSYDIITKGHGGQMTAETKEGEYAEFIISLPAN